MSSTASTKKTQAEAAELAQTYGFAYAFLQSDPDLKRIFEQAVNGDGKNDPGNWTAAKFIAMLRGTNWYKKNAESVRQYQLLKTSDPSTFAARSAARVSLLADQAAKVGAVISSSQLKLMADHAMMFDWNDNQIADNLAGYVKATNGVYNGQAGTDVGNLKQTAWRNGVNISDAAINSFAQQIAAGTGSVGYYQQYIRNMAKTTAPGYADQIDAGMDLYDVADPYRQSMAKILEINPNDIDLSDATLRGAMSTTTADGKPSTKSLWQFETELRKDPRWLQTNNARDGLMSVAHGVLQNFGFSS